MSNPTMAQLMAEIKSQKAVADERDKTTTIWRESHDKRHATLDRRLMRLEETAAQGKGALSLFLKIGSIAAALAVIAAGAIAIVKGSR